MKFLLYAIYQVCGDAEKPQLLIGSGEFAESYFIIPVTTMSCLKIYFCFRRTVKIAGLLNIFAFVILSV